MSKKVKMESIEQMVKNESCYSCTKHKTPACPPKRLTMETKRICTHFEKSATYDGDDPNYG